MHYLTTWNFLNLQNSHFIDSAALYWRLLGYVKPYWRMFALAIVGMVVAAITEPALPALLKPLLDGGFVNQEQSIIVWTPILLVLIGILRGAAGFVTGVGMTWVASRLVMDLRQAMFARLLALPTRDFDETSAGVLLSKLTYDVNRVMQAGTDALVVLVRDSLTVFGLLAWMFYLNWSLTLIVFSIVPLIVWVIRVVGKRLRRINLNMQRAMGEITQVAEEAIQGHKLVKVFAGQDYERERFACAANDARRQEVKIQVASNASMFVVQLLTAVALAVIIYIATLQSTQDQITVGGFISLFTAMGMLFAPIKRLTKVNEHLQQGLAAAQSVFGLLDREVEPDRGQHRPQRLRGEIRFEQVEFSYEAGDAPVLKKLDFQVAPGETVALVGASGSGKSTLANLLPRFYPLENGRILLDGVDLNEFSLAALRANLALVSQDVVLFNDSIAANIAYGASGEVSREAIHQAAEAAHALEFIQAMPRGFDTLIGERGVKLSGGQRQRLAIARALLKDAPILIFDEATSALDNQAEYAVQRALESLRGQRTVILIAHRLSTIENADRILVMRDGRIVESGGHAELLQSGGVYARLYQAQRNGEPTGGA